DIGRLKKAEVGLKSGANVLIFVVQIECMAAARDLQVAGRTSGVRRGGTAVLVAYGGALYHLAVRRPVLAEACGKVNTTDAIPAAAKFLVGIDSPQAGAFANVAGQTGHSNLGVLSVKRIGRRHGLARQPVVNGKD